MSKKLLLKKLENWKKVSPEKFREEDFSETARGFLVLYGKSHKAFKEKDAVKKTCEKLFLF